MKQPRSVQPKVKIAHSMQIPHSGEICKIQSLQGKIRFIEVKSVIEKAKDFAIVLDIDRSVWCLIHSLPDPCGSEVVNLALLPKNQKFEKGQEGKKLKIYTEEKNFSCLTIGRIYRVEPTEYGVCIYTRNSRYCCIRR